MACLIACSNDSSKEPDQPQETLPTPVLSFSSVNLPNEGDSFSCKVYGLKEGEWSAECDQSWCTVSVSGNILKISAAPNDGDSFRTSYISIINSNHNILGKVTVHQTSAIEPEYLEYSVTKHSFFPIFTATWCPYSPNMDKILEDIQRLWDYPILPMRIHVDNSELYIPLASELSDLYNNSATPTGYFENYSEVPNITDPNLARWYLSSLIRSMTQSESGYNDGCSTIACKSSVSDNTITADISVKAVQPGSYRLMVFILEDNIIKPQMSKTIGEIPDYCHNAVLVGALTPAKGQELELNKSIKTFSINGETPHEVNLSNLRLLIVLERDEPQLNYSDNCWFVDNCLSVSPGKSASGYIENIHIGDEIEN